VRDRPEIYEREIFIEKPIIHIQPIIYQENNVIREMRETHEKHYFVREEPIVVQDIKDAPNVKLNFSK